MGSKIKNSVSVLVLFTISLFLLNGCGNKATVLTQPTEENEQTLKEDSATQKDNAVEDEDINRSLEYAKPEGINKAFDLVETITGKMLVQDLSNVSSVQFDFWARGIELRFFDTNNACIQDGFSNYDEPYNIYKYPSDYLCKTNVEEHDEKGNIIVKHIGLDTYLYEYDENGQVISETIIVCINNLEVPSEQILENIDFDDEDKANHYDIESAVDSALTDFFNNLEFDYTRYEYQYNENGDIAKEVCSWNDGRDGYIKEYFYTGRQLIEQKKYSDSKLQSVDTFTYDTMGRINQAIHEDVDSDEIDSSCIRNHYYDNRNMEAILTIYKTQPENNSLIITKHF